MLRASAPISYVPNPVGAPPQMQPTGQMLHRVMGPPMPAGPAVKRGVSAAHYSKVPGGSISISAAAAGGSSAKKRKKIGDKKLPASIRELVPESQAYADLQNFEKKLDATLRRKCLDIQEALKRPSKIKRKLRICISNTYVPGKEEGSSDCPEGTAPSWELRVEGRLQDEPTPAPNAKSTTVRRKFSSFFKSLVIELDKDIYGPDNHLVEWHRSNQTNETDGFQVKRPGNQSVKCTILLLLDYQPMKFKLDPRLARLLGIHTETRPRIVEAMWQYVKSQQLQDPHERDYVNCDRYLQQIFQCPRMRFMELPQRLAPLLHQPDPIVINHMIMCDANDHKKFAFYDIDVEIDDPVKSQMQQFLTSIQGQQDILMLDSKIQETVEQICQYKVQREFFVTLADNPSGFVEKWLISQSRDLKTIKDSNGLSVEERQSDFYTKSFMREAVPRYMHNLIDQRKLEMEQSIGRGS